MLVSGQSERFHIRHDFDGHDVLPAHAIDDHVARGCEDKILLGIFRRFGFRRFIDPHIEIAQQIGNLIGITSVMMQELNQRGFQWQHLAHKQSGRALCFLKQAFRTDLTEQT